MNDQVTRKPGRPPRAQSPAGLTPFERTAEGLDMSDGRDPNSAELAKRVRVPLGSGQSVWFMNYPFDHDNYYYYTFHDDANRGGRIAEALAAFYEHCQINGENVKRPSGNGWDYLMRLPMEYHLEDMERQKQRANALEKAQNTLKSTDKIQDYGIDPKSGRPIFEGEAIAKQHSSDNPYT